MWLYYIYNELLNFLFGNPTKNKNKNKNEKYNGVGWSANGM